MNGQKTGGRQKGTPNKITASVKYMFKALMMNNYDLVEDSFQKAKPNERLTFIAKMTPFLCAKEQPSKNGGEWVMDQSMDHEWFQMYECDHLLRRKQRIEHEENYAIQDINSQYSYEWQMIHDACAQFNRLGMDGEDVKQMIYKRVDEFFNEQRKDKDRVRENFQQRRENFMKIEQEFFNEKDPEEETAEVAKSEVAAEVVKEEANQQSSLETQNLAIPLSRNPENPHLNSSTLDSASQSVVKAEEVAEEAANQQSEEDSRNTEIPISQYPEEAAVKQAPANAASNSKCLTPSTLDSAAAQSEDEFQCLNPSTLDSAAAQSAVKVQCLNPSTIDSAAAQSAVKVQCLNPSTLDSTAAQSEYESQCLNPSTLDSAAAQSEDESQCLNPSTLDCAAAQSAVKVQCLNPSTLDSAAAQSAVKAQRLNPSTIGPKPSLQKPNIRLLRQQQHRPFYTAIANKRHR